ncbi:MAG: hypothetical protein KDI34_15940 [Halioglobus sp.]|nr:hypothetical protein [Halioglobus sp.]
MQLAGWRGNWHGTGLDDRTLTALLMSDGEYLLICSATASSGCLVTGTIKPQVLVNIYDLEITFGAVPFFRPGKVVSGSGFLDPNTNLLLIGLDDSARNRGLVFPVTGLAALIPMATAWWMLRTPTRITTAS